MSPLCLHCLRNASARSHAVIIITEQNSLLLTGQTAGFMGKNVLKTREFAVILGVWKVLAPLLHHLLNGVPAVSSWLEFVAGAYLLSHYMLYACASVKPLHSQIAPFSKLHFHSLDSIVISKKLPVGQKESNCSVDKRKDKTPSDIAC